jgi:UPF0755 protein
LARRKKKAAPPPSFSFAGFATRLFLFVLLLCVAAGAYVWRYINTPFPLAHTPAEFTLERGTTMKMAAFQLAGEGLITQPGLFVWIARLHGDASRIKAGSYELTEPVTPMQLLSKLSEGDVTSASLLLVEGWNWKQVRAALAKSPDLRHDTAAMKDADVDAALGIEAPTPEGMFFPDTYHFAKQSSDLDVLKRAYAAMQRKLAAAWEARAPNLPLKSPYEALTLASIVEKETGRANDRAMVAAVFNNRLTIGMRLQTDPSVIYGLGARYDGTIHKVDLETDTVYNTYTRAGLTPTPIAMPGEAALYAALNPAKSKALYFVAKGDGSSYFSDTLAEHNQAVRRYQLGGK